MTGGEAAKTDNEVKLEMNSTHHGAIRQKEPKVPDVIENLLAPDHMPGLSCAKEINLYLVSVTVLFDFPTPVAKTNQA